MQYVSSFCNWESVVVSFVPFVSFFFFFSFSYLRVLHTTYTHLNFSIKGEGEGSHFLKSKCKEKGRIYKSTEFNGWSIY